MSDGGTNRRTWVRRRVLFPLILMVALVAMTTLLFEVVIRVAAPFSPFVRLLTRTQEAQRPAESLAEFLDRHGLGYQPGRASGGRFRNSLGLPSAEPREGSQARVVVLGDSFVVNDYPVGWMWPYLLGQRLASADEETLSQSVEVLTFALPGIGPHDYEALWDLAGREVEPDRVFVSFFVGNDFQNFRELRASTPPALRSALFFRNFWRFLRNRALRGDGLTQRLPAPPPSGEDRFGREVPGYEEAFDNQRASLAEDYYRALKGEVANVFSVDNHDLLQTEIVRVAEIMARICSKAEAMDASCTVVIFPDELQVETELRSALLAALGREDETFDFGRPSAALASRLTEMGVDVIDLLPCLGGAEHALYRSRDTHLNRRGNLRAAECIAERFE